MGDYFFNSSFSTRWISRCLFTYSLFPVRPSPWCGISAFKIDLFRQVLFFVIILCSGRAGRYRYELGYDGPDRWFIMRRVATSPIAAPASDRVPPSNLWDAAFSGLQSEWHALLRIPCAPSVILIRGNGVEILACLTCCGRKTKD
jgi:hypothetical protein